MNTQAMTDAQRQRKYTQNLKEQGKGTVKMNVPNVDANRKLLNRLAEQLRTNPSAEAMLRQTVDLMERHNR